jgi:hypothetical protein
VTKPKAVASRLSSWQQQAIAELRTIAAEHPDAIEVVTATPTLTETHAFLTIRLSTKDLPTEPGGLRFLDHEEFIVGIRKSPLAPPQVEVEHTRFAGYAHVLQGQRLCIYLDPAREWDPLGGMLGFLERLWTWLADAAAGRFNASTAMYHAVGGVLHRTPGTPTIVIREPIPGKPFQRSCLVSRTAHRLDMTFLSTPPAGQAMPVLTLTADLPFGAGVTLAQLLQLIDRPYSFGPLGHTGLGPTPARAVLTSLATSAIRNAEGTHQYFTLAVPHPSGGPTHLLVGRLPTAASDELRRLARNHGPTIDIDPAGIDKEIAIEWCNVSDERSEVTSRRDHQRPVNVFKDKSVHIWGCGGLGSWLAEFVVRAGAAKIGLCDYASVIGGLLIRQNYVETDIGQAKTEALATRVRAISDRVEVLTIPSAPPDNLEEILASTDVIIDATVNIAVGQALTAACAQGPRHAVLAQAATDTRTGTLGILTVSAPSDADGPTVIDARAGKTVLADPALELYQPLWQEALDGHELIPTRGCSVPTFHGSAADLAAVAACLLNLLALHLTTPTSGTHLISLPYSHGEGPHHQFIEA